MLEFAEKPLPTNSYVMNGRVWHITGEFEPSMLERPAKAYLLSPHSHGKLQRIAIADVKKALELAPPGDATTLAWFHASAGIAAYREHQPKKAESHLSEAVRLGGPNTDIRGLALLFRAMARRQLGRTTQPAPTSRISKPA
jgi:hypothetical protein